MRRRAWLRLCAIIVVTGCGGASGPAATSPAPQQDYRIAHGDQLEVAVWPDNELGLSGEFSVEEDGRVHLPLVGAVDVAGKTLPEVRTQLRSAYGEALKEPVVRVTPHFPVSVLGAVNRPGVYRVTPSESLFDVIGLAGGFTRGAEQDDVRIVRDGTALELDARLTSGVDLDLRSGDRIVVSSGWGIGMRDVLFGLQSIGLIITLASRI